MYTGSFFIVIQILWWFLPAGGIAKGEKGEGKKQRENIAESVIFMTNYSQVMNALSATQCTYIQNGESQPYLEEKAPGNYPPLCCSYASQSMYTFRIKGTELAYYHKDIISIT